MTEERIASTDVRARTDEFEYRFDNHPRYEPVERYEEALETFLERIEDVPGVVSVYESGTGGVSVPGISDIDLVVVVENDVDDTTALRERIEDAKIDEYFFHHGPEVLTRASFSEYYNVLPMPKDLRLHYGEELSYEKNRDEYNYLAYLVDQVNTTYPFEFLEFLFFPGITLRDRQYDIAVNDFIDLFAPSAVARQLPVWIDTRFAVHRLNSLRNDMQLFVQSAGVDAPVLDRFDERITEMRGGWFEHDRQTKERLLRECLEDAVTACFAFVGHLRDHLHEEGVEIAASASEYRSSDVYTNVYLLEWAADGAERTTLSLWAERRIKSCVLPQAVTVNDRLRDDDPAVDAPVEYGRALEARDRTRERREQSMQLYTYHPLRSKYMTVLGWLQAAKTRLVT